ncbi:MAG: DUF1851 domain-containing protein [Burkholderiaceae bacterium]|nr:DUF1851 domain-containing protein [Burkholderiaceae bacterium]
MSYLISPTSLALESALDSWQWLDLGNKEPILVTAFADVFFSAPNGIWFLDTLEGKLKHVFDTREQLDNALSTEEGQDMYLLSPFVDRAIRDGQSLTESQCYDFKLHPVVGGEVVYENIQRLDFVVALNIRGQLYDQVRNLKPGTKITGFNFDDEKEQKPWWKFW